MVLTIFNYGDPVLRRKGARVDAVTPEIRELAANMLETMYANRGIGLAAQQVGAALQLTVIDVRGITDRPSTLEMNGAPANLDDAMPMVLLNPEIQPLGPPALGAEGCLSFPEIYADIARPDPVQVRATTLEARPTEFRCSGLLARAVQHETDHLHGILFIDRMERSAKDELRPELEALQAATKAALKR
jgi:peptide deformylase